MRTRLFSNIYRLGVKELWSLWRDPVLLVLIAYVFTVSIYTAATAMPESLHNAPIAIVDEDGSPLSQRIAGAFYPPQFAPPAMIDRTQMDPGMDSGTYTFVLNIPPNFQRDVLAGRSPELQLNVDATRMSQAFTGNSYVQQIVSAEVSEFVRRFRGATALPVDLVVRARFNPALDKVWFGGLMQIINNVTMLSIILTGAALIREREHGTVEHLLVMPLVPVEIMLANVIANGLVILVGAGLSLVFVVEGWLGVPISGSIPLFLFGAGLYALAVAALGILLGTIASSMGQFGLLVIPILLLMQLLSGSSTPMESMPFWLQIVVQTVSPTPHFVALAQAVLYRGAGLSVVWPQLLALAALGSIYFAFALTRFRRVIFGV